VYALAWADAMIASAILDRFLHHADLIKINGKSYLMKEAASV
jgi:DNA replication protein DnaC